LALAAQPPKRPKLIVTIIVDQFRYDYLTRFQQDYNSGLERLLTKGAVFTNARYEHFPTVTAIGHSTVLTGATPSISGIVGNDWYERETGKQVTSVSDPDCRMVGGPEQPCMSPRRLLVSSVGDELKISNGGKSRVIGVSVKDRAAILPAGHMANAAYWLDTKTGRFVTSNFYRPDLPPWVNEFNSEYADHFKGSEWLGRKMPLDEKIYPAIVASPFGNELVLAFAERAIRGEELGRGLATDLLTVSFSSNDYVGHEYGPDSEEVRDMSIRTDRLLGRLFEYLDKQIGLQNVLIVFTADHGVAPLPEVNAGRRLPGGRMPPGIIQKTVQAELEKRFGPGDWIVSPSEHSLYLNDHLIREKKLNGLEVASAAKAAALTIPHVFRVYTREQLMNGNTLEDQVGRRVMNGFYFPRSADVYIMLEPYWIYSRTGTTHGTTFMYDAHVPVIFMGSGIRPGKYHQAAAVNDIAPTLSTILEIETPSGSVGRVLGEMLTGLSE
jgi:hypothetical protein